MKKALNILTGLADEGGSPRGTTKAEVKKLSGSDWSESDWRRMVRHSNKCVTTSMPFFDKESRKWYWL